VNQRKAEAALVWNTAVWGSTFVVVKAALADVSPILFLALRFSIASLVLAPLLAGKRRVSWDWRTAGAGALVGACLFCGYLTQTLA
jgi:drug/metabolite transporter (DMT)-like permease